MFHIGIHCMVFKYLSIKERRNYINQCKLSLILYKALNNICVKKNTLMCLSNDHIRPDDFDICFDLEKMHIGGINVNNNIDNNNDNDNNHISLCMNFKKLCVNDMNNINKKNNKLIKISNHKFGSINFKLYPSIMLMMRIKKKKKYFDCMYKLKVVDNNIDKFSRKRKTLKL